MSRHKLGAHHGRSAQPDFQTAQHFGFRASKQLVCLGFGKARNLHRLKPG